MAAYVNSLCSLVLVMLMALAGALADHGDRRLPLTELKVFL